MSVDLQGNMFGKKRNTFFSFLVTHRRTQDVYLKVKD